MGRGIAVAAPARYRAILDARGVDPGAAQQPRGRGGCTHQSRQRRLPSGRGGPLPLPRRNAADRDLVGGAGEALCRQAGSGDPRRPDVPEREASPVFRCIPAQGVVMAAWAPVVYLLCFVTSGICAWLLVRSYL